MPLRTLYDGDGRALGRLLGRLSRVKNRRPIVQGERPVVDPTVSKLRCSGAVGGVQSDVSQVGAVDHSLFID
jgi:hypothetical protein